MMFRVEVVADWVVSGAAADSGVVFGAFEVLAEDNSLAISSRKKPE